MNDIRARLRLAKFSPWLHELAPLFERIAAPWKIMPVGKREGAYRP
ncbi:MAG: hypothetical protein WCC90_17290 [Methylocella sp.]